MHWQKNLLCFFIFVECCLFLNAAPFTINNNTRTDSPPDSAEATSQLIELDNVNPQVSVNTPNGVLTWMSGEIHNITWSATDSNLFPNQVNIVLSMDGGATYPTLIAVGEVNDGEYSWTIPTMTSFLAKVKVIALDSFGNVGSDHSDGTFTVPGQIVSVTSGIAMDTVDPVAELVKPDATTVGYIDEQNEIQWSASDNHLIDQPIQLQYQKNSTAPWVNIQAALENTSSYLWTVPDVVTPEARVCLVVTDTFGNTASEISNSFCIKHAEPATPLGVSITRLNNQDVRISWNAVTKNIHDIPIQLSSYQILYNDTSGPENDSDYQLLAQVSCSDTNYEFTPTGTLGNSFHSFYRVLAIKDYDKRSNNTPTGLVDSTKKAAFQTSNHSIINRLKQK